MSDCLNSFAPQLQKLQAYVAPAPSTNTARQIKLDAMENPYPIPEKLKQAWLQRMSRVAFNRYPDAAALELKAALAGAFPTPNNWPFLLGNGSDEIIQMLCMAVAKPGACVMAPDPSFVMYKHLAVACGVDFHAVPLQDDFSLDRAAFLAAIEQHQPALIFIAQPNNPTGNAFAVEDVEDICAAATGLVVLDEAYIPYADGDSTALAARHEGVLLMRTLSKWGLAGLRLGFLQGPEKYLAELEKLRLPYNINVLTQETAVFALEHPDVFGEQIQILRAERELLIAALAELPGTQVYPSATNFLLVRQSPEQAAKVFQALQAAGLLIKNLSGGHPALQGCLRPSVGTPEENQALVSVWTEALRGG